MGRLTMALAQAATTTVEAGGLHWRIVRITSRDLAAANAGFMLLAAPVLDKAGALLDEDAEEPAKAAAVEEAVKAFVAAAKSPEAVVAPAKFNEALVCAGVRAVSDDGETWEDLRLVNSERRHAPEAGRMHVSALPPGVLSVLSGAVLDLTTDDKEASRRLAGFLGSEPDPAGRPGETVPPAPE